MNTVGGGSRSALIYALLPPAPPTPVVDILPHYKMLVIFITDGIVVLYTM